MFLALWHCGLLKILLFPVAILPSRSSYYVPITLYVGSIHDNIARRLLASDGT